MENNIYKEKSINKLILTFSLPAILSLIVEILTSVVDTAFAGHLGSYSSNALTAMGLISPILGMYTAFQALYAVSTSILIARHFNNHKVRDSYFSTGFIFSLLVSGTVSLISLFIMEILLQFLGAEGDVLKLAKDYLEIQLISNVFSAVGYTLTSCIRAFGYPKVEAILTTLSVVVNILFNIVFVFIFHLGLSGLSWGTFVSELFCAIASFLWLKKKELLPKQYPTSCKEIFREAKVLFQLGVAQTLIQMLAGCTGFFVNHNLLIHTTVNHVAAWNVVQKLYTLMLMPIVGITQGVQTMIAYYSGQNKENEKQQTVKKTLLYTILYGVLGMIITFFLGNKILLIFGVTGIIYSISSKALNIIFITFPIVGVFYTVMTLLEVTGHEIKAVLLGLIRQVFVIIPLVYLLPILIPNSMLSAFLAVPIADVITLFLSVAFLK